MADYLIKGFYPTYRVGSGSGGNTSTPTVVSQYWVLQSKFSNQTASKVKNTVWYETLADAKWDDTKYWNDVVEVT